MLFCCLFGGTKIKYARQFANILAASPTNDGTYFIIFHAVVFVGGAMRTKRICNAVHGYQPQTYSTVIGARMSHWKWRETKQHPSRTRSGYQISCSLVSLHFLCDILAPITVYDAQSTGLRSVHV